MSRPVLALGLMSGTSRDGIDAALLTSDGLSQVETGAHLTVPYDAAFRAALAAAICGEADLGAVEQELTRRHAEAVEALLRTSGVARPEVRIIGFHGHTVAHDPERRITRQIGDGAALAHMTGIEVACDFRSADVLAGGQGAPLAPLYHSARAAGLEKPLAVLNLGGVGNVTWLGADGEVMAFDTGPGNALLDDLLLRRRGVPFDRDGALALSGRPDARVLSELLAHGFFERRPPKSLDRDQFDSGPVSGLCDADAAATLAAFTARAAARAGEHFPAPARRWLVAGGGRHNPAIMRELGEALPVPVDPVESVGWDGDAIEAQAFAYLAVRVLKELPLSVPGTTGVPEPMTGGRLHPAPQGGPSGWPHVPGRD